MADPDTILLDEPAAGDQPRRCSELIIDRVLDLNAQGTAILLIEHNMEMVLAALLARRRHGGRALPQLEGTPDDIARDQAVVRRLSRQGGVMEGEGQSCFPIRWRWSPATKRDQPIVRGVDFKLPRASWC